MSKILRRPMFRGGGKVSSYGNGITAPLVSGYQGGGQIGGGIIYGKPMSDGRYGFEEPILKDFAPQINLGQSVSDLANKKVSAMSPLLISDTEDTNYLPAGVLQSDKLVTIKQPEKQKATEYDTGFGESEVGITDGFGPGLEILSTEELYEQKIDNILKKIENGKRLSPSEEKIRIEKNIKNYDEINNKGETQISKEEVLKTDNETIEIKTETENLLADKDNIKDTEASITINPKDAIAENQELFKELLGSKQARGQDIADMLLRFSGSEGDTVGEKFRNYTRAESAAGPGRSEKISQTAAGLAINDFVAGKRSAEQIDKLKEVETFRQGIKDASVSLSVTDDISMAKAKAAKLTDKGINSDEVTKTLLSTKLNKPIRFFRSKVKMKDIKNKFNKLKPGYNVIDDDGTDIIVLYDGTNAPNILGTIDQLWSK